MQDHNNLTTPAQKRPKRRGVSTFTLILDRRNWPVWIVPVLCAVVFAGQMLGLVPIGDWAFSPAAMAQGRWWTILTSIFLHSNDPAFGYIHIASNMWAYLNLAPLVIARFGKGWRSVVPYHAFYLLAGLAGNVLFWLLHPGGEVPLVGASGAVYGVYAAMMRLDLFRERLTPVISRNTLKALWFLVWSNLLVLVLFGGPLIVLQILAGQGADLVVPIAWEAHLGGFIAGLFLVGLMKGRGWDNDWKAGLRLIRVDGPEV